MEEIRTEVLSEGSLKREKPIVPQGSKEMKREASQTEVSPGVVEEVQMQSLKAKYSSLAPKSPPKEKRTVQTIAQSQTSLSRTEAEHEVMQKSDFSQRYEVSAGSVRTKPDGMDRMPAEMEPFYNSVQACMRWIENKMVRIVKDFAIIFQYKPHRV